MIFTDQVSIVVVDKNVLCLISLLWFVDINLELLGGGGLYCYSAWSVITYLITCHVIVVHTQQETCNMIGILKKLPKQGEDSESL